MPEAIVVIAIASACVLVVLILGRLVSFDSRLNGLSRLEAKVDALLKHQGVRYDPLGEVPAGVKDALDRGEKIEAIRLVRQARGIDLKSAKEYVDELQRLRGGG